MPRVPFSIVLTMALLATTGSAVAYEPSASLVVWGPAIGMADPTLGEARTGRLITVCRDLGVSRIHWMVDPDDRIRTGSGDSCAGPRQPASTSTR